MLKNMPKRETEAKQLVEDAKAGMVGRNEWWEKMDGLCVMEF